MFENELFITITGHCYYFDKKAFKIGEAVTLKKEPDNPYDREAITVLAPVLGKAGYVANSPRTVADGTMSAGRLYDRIPDECAAVVLFMTSSRVIAHVLPDKKIDVTITTVWKDAGEHTAPAEEDLAF